MIYKGFPYYKKTSTVKRLSTYIHANVTNMYGKRSILWPKQDMCCLMAEPQSHRAKQNLIRTGIQVTADSLVTNETPSASRQEIPKSLLRVKMANQVTDSQTVY